MNKIDGMIFDILRSRCRWNRKARLRVAEIQELASVRFGRHLPAAQIKDAVERLVLNRQIRWARVRDRDIYVLV